MNLLHGFPKAMTPTPGMRGQGSPAGERQRIAIARAILKNAPIVILDEATAFTDPENEDKLQQSIDRLTQGKTLIVIAHRLSTIMYADQILVLEDGQITARGHPRAASDQFGNLSGYVEGSYQRHGLEYESGGERVMLKNHPACIAVKRRSFKKDLGQLRLRLFRIHVRSVAYLCGVLRFKPITERPRNYRPDLGHRSGTNHRRARSAQHFQILSVSAAEHGRL